MTRRPADAPHQVPGTHVHDELAARRARRAGEQRLRDEPHLWLLEREHGVRLTVEELQAADRRMRQVPSPRRREPAPRDSAPRDSRSRESRPRESEPRREVSPIARLSPVEEPSSPSAEPTRTELDEETLSLQLLVWRRLGPRGFAGFMRDLEEMEAELAKARDDGWGEPG
ncbi:hypothetical protein ACIBCT_36480 [Streptosporangium sp. NPDC050855]|uniref:hypothetical protein n=1 Tax=Streptosporangium sp. NPDC050855 TaxID=3366194 RepID=UPI00378FE91F